MKITIKMRVVLLAIALVALIGSKAAKAQTTITFDDAPDPIFSGISNGYKGLDWNNGFGSRTGDWGLIDGTAYFDNPSGYQAGLVSGDYVAYGQGFGFSSATPLTFDSVYLTSAWLDNMDVVVTGYLGGVATYSQTVLTSATAPTLFNFDWTNVDAVTFVGTGGTSHVGYFGGGEYMAIDNLTITQGSSVTPEGSSLAMFALGGLPLVIGVGRKLRRKTD